MSARPASYIHGYLISLRQDPFSASTVCRKLEETNQAVSSFFASSMDLFPYGTASSPYIFENIEKDPGVCQLSMLSLRHSGSERTGTFKTNATVLVDKGEAL